MIDRASSTLELPNMFRLNASDLALAVQLMAGMRAWLNCDSSMGTGNPALLGFLIEQHVRGTVDALPISQTVKNQLITLQADALRADDTNEQCRALGTRVEVFIQTFASDLSNALFLAVNEKYKLLYEQPEPLFGANVAAKFPAANPEIEAAGQCLALEQWNAAVFHLMRVLEHGLRKTARSLGVKMPVHIDLANWLEIIRAIETEIASRTAVLANAKRTSRRDKKLTYYAEVASNFRYFKDGWRNHVSHGRANYDETQAEVVYSHVRTFMQLLAGGAPS